MLSPPTSVLLGRDAVTLGQALGLLAFAADPTAAPGSIHPDPAIAGDIAACLGLPAAVEHALRHGRAADLSATASFLPLSASLTLVADVAELRLPWLAGHARRVAVLAQDAAALAGLGEDERRLLVRAALLHGIGRGAVPLAVWGRKSKLSHADWDLVRRSPYWNARAGERVAGLDAELQLASQVQERLDGSGYYRRLGAEALGMPQRLLAVSNVFVALHAPRPWRGAHDAAAARALLEAQVSGGRLDRAALDAVCAAAVQAKSFAPASSPLSDRETEVLRRLALGQSERDTARALRLSSGAIRSHLEHILAALGCATLPAATLRALTLNLI